MLRGQTIVNGEYAPSRKRCEPTAEGVVSIQIACDHASAVEPHQDRSAGTWLIDARGAGKGEIANCGNLRWFTRIVPAELSIALADLRDGGARRRRQSERGNLAQKRFAVRVQRYPSFKA
jgi:hypothetical protein